LSEKPFEVQEAIRKSPDRDREIVPVKSGGVVSIKHGPNVYKEKITTQFG
jgi:hypothetical protein